MYPIWKRTLVTSLIVGAVVFMGWANATDQAFYRPLCYFLPVAFVVLFTIQAFRGSRRSKRPRAGESIRPAMEGLGEVQDLYLGRKPADLPVFGSPQPSVAEQVVAYRDPLEGPWLVVGPRDNSTPDRSA